MPPRRTPASSVKSGMRGPACLIVVKSVHHQNTAKIAHAMAEVLGAECVTPEELLSTSLDGYRLVGFGWLGREFEFDPSTPTGSSTRIWMRENGS